MVTEGMSIALTYGHKIVVSNRFARHLDHGLPGMAGAQPTPPSRLANMDPLTSQGPFSQ